MSYLKPYISWETVVKEQLLSLVLSTWTDRWWIIDHELHSLVLFLISPKTNVSIILFYFEYMLFTYTSKTKLIHIPYQTHYCMTFDYSHPYSLQKQTLNFTLRISLFGINLQIWKLGLSFVEFWRGITDDILPFDKTKCLYLKRFYKTLNF